jgi:hypothetical protein
MSDVTTQWERAGFGQWRRERGALLRARSSRLDAYIVDARGLARAEVSLGSTTVLRDCESEEAARVWCDRWAEILLREGDR